MKPLPVADARCLLLSSPCPRTCRLRRGGRSVFCRLPHSFSAELQFAQCPEIRDSERSVTESRLRSTILALAPRSTGIPSPKVCLGSQPGYLGLRQRRGEAAT